MVRAALRLSDHHYRRIERKIGKNKLLTELTFHTHL